MEKVIVFHPVSPKEDVPMDFILKRSSSLKLVKALIKAGLTEHTVCKAVPISHYQYAKLLKEVSEDTLRVA